jgi:hypothetical protein
MNNIIIATPCVYQDDDGISRSEVHAEFLAKDIDNYHYQFFDTMVDETGRYLSEDYAFCRRWQAIGGKIHADMNSCLTHHGQYLYQGNLFESLVAHETAKQAVRG